MGNLLFRSANAAAEFQGRADEFLTTAIFTNNQTLYGYLRTTYASVLLFSAVYLPWRVWSRPETAPEAVIDRKERRFAYVCMAVSMCPYFVPVIIWTVMNQQLF